MGVNRPELIFPVFRMIMSNNRVCDNVRKRYIELDMAKNFLVVTKIAFYCEINISGIASMTVIMVYVDFLRFFHAFTNTSCLLTVYMYY